MIERVARAIFNERFGHCVGEHWDSASGADKSSHHDMARAAIEAMREPTEEMRIGGNHEAMGCMINGWDEDDCADGVHIWKGMIDVALKDKAND